VFFKSVHEAINNLRTAYKTQMTWTVCRRYGRQKQYTPCRNLSPQNSQNLQKADNFWSIWNAQPEAHAIIVYNFTTFSNQPKITFHSLSVITYLQDLM